MDLLRWFKDKFGTKTKEAFIASSIEPVSAYMPKTLNLRYSFINPRYPRVWLNTIEKAVLANPDLSQVFELIIDLSNTGHTLQIVGKQSDEAKAELDNLAVKLNTDSLVNQLFAQIALYGAISIEGIVEEDLTGLKKIVRVPPPTVYFKYNEETKEFEPYQMVGLKEPVKLNPNTYLYLPVITIDGSPYGIPPMLAALSTLEVQEELRAELKNLAKKIGLMGFLDVEFPLLERSSTETQTEYLERCQAHLEKVAQQISENISKGIFLHYEGTKAQFKETGSKTADMDRVISHINRWVISGAKAQPSLLGISEGITETWAVVSYEQFARQLQNYQRAVKRAMEYFYRLHLALTGIDVEDVNVNFAPVPKLKPEADIEVFVNKAKAVSDLVVNEIITIDEAREFLGLNPGGVKNERTKEVYSKVWDSLSHSPSIHNNGRH